MGTPAEQPELKRAQKKLDEQRAALDTDAPIEEVPPEEAPPEVEPEDTQPPTEPEVVPEPEATPQPEAEAEPTEPDNRDERIADLTKKLNTADGRFGSELAELRRQMEDASTRLTQTQQENLILQKQVQLLQNPVAEPTAGESLSYDKYFSGISKEVLDGYDEDALKVIVDVARNVANAQKQALSDDVVAPLEESLKELKAQSAKNSFTSRAEALAPGFTAANGDPDRNVSPSQEWLAFLEQTAYPDISPETWRDMATRIGTPEIAANIFLTWQRATESPATEASPPKPETKGTKRPSVKAQVAPSRSSAQTVGDPATPAPSDSPLNRVGYEKLLRDMAATGGYTDENRKLLKQYQLADMEGRLE